MKRACAAEASGLRLGDVAQTVPTFSSESFSPLGFISNDLDYYTSTRDSFAC
jgi:hypothetical protein